MYRPYSSPPIHIVTRFPLRMITRIHLQSSFDAVNRQINTFFNDYKDSFTTTFHSSFDAVNRQINSFFFIVPGVPKGRTEHLSSQVSAFFHRKGVENCRKHGFSSVWKWQTQVANSRYLEISGICVDVCRNILGFIRAYRI